MRSLHTPALTHFCIDVTSIYFHILQYIFGGVYTRGLHAFAPLRLQYFSKFSSRIANVWCRLHMFWRLWCEAFTPQRLKRRFKQIQTNFKRLVLFCIDTKFCKKIFVGQLLTRSTRFTCFCTAQTSIFQQNFVIFFHIFRQNFQNLVINNFQIIFIEFCSDFN